MTLKQATIYAKAAVSLLSPYCERIAVAGSIRRECPECNDIDLVIIPKIKEVKDLLGDTVEKINFLKMFLNDYVANGKASYIQNGDHNVLLKLPKVQLDIFFADAESWGSVLMCRTGSKQHNIIIAELAGFLGGRWHTTVGLYLNGKVYSQTEEIIYSALKIPYLSPTEREADLMRHIKIVT